jgi:hypothetical protein
LGGTMLVLHLDNAHVRQQLARLRGQRQQAEHLRADNRQLQEIIARTQADATDGTRAIHADLVRVRGEVDELERKGRASYAELRTQAAQDAEHLANNRNPEAGLTPLEYFQNKGQGTPADAFQSFVWAAMKGEDATLAHMIAMDDAARQKCIAVVAALPEESRTRFSTPEKLAGLFFAAALTAQPSAQVLAVSFPDAQHAIVQVRGLADKTQKIPMQLAAQGWQIILPAGMAERLGGWALGRASSSPGK